MKPLITLLFVLLASLTFAQDSITEEMRLKYRKNQHQLDLNHGGIGLSFYRPGLGNLVTYDNPWVGVNMLSDVFEFKLGFGRTHVKGTIPYGFSFTEDIDTREFGSHISAGFNAPLPFLTFGAQKSPSVIFRGHPVIAGEFGAFRFHNYANYFGDAQTSIIYLGVNPGYRLRLPFGSVEFNLNARLGMTIGDNDDYYKGIGIHPSLTFRLDALKWKYNPDMIKVQGTLTTLSNVQSRTEYAGTRYNSDGSRVEYYNVYTTADVNVQNLTVGVQDIGPHFGIGPKFAFMNPRRTPFVPESYLVGIVGEGRRSFYDFGITLEGGKIGHGSELIAKDDDEGRYRKKLNKNETFGMGTLNTVNVYANAGIDISPLFLAPFGLVVDMGEATSFLSATAGFIVGGHYSFGQSFNDPIVQTAYDQLVSEDQGVAKRKFLDPSVVGAGFLGGYYFSVQIGAMSFKVTNYRYFGAPFASNTLMSIAYRFPLN